MSKKICAIFLVFVVLFGVFAMSACEQDSEEVEVLTARQQAFVDAVEAIKTPITLDSGVAIDAARTAYSFLDEYEKNSKKVSESLAILNGYDSEYTSLLENSGNQGGGNTDDAQKELITRFLAAVEALPTTNELTIEDRAAINNAIAIYNLLTEISKENKDVVVAYSKLEKASNRVTALEEAANQETWQRMADEFISAVADIDEVTLEIGSLLEDLLYEYDHFPDGVKNIGGMALAKAVLDEKYAQYERIRDLNDIQEFVTAVRAIGEVTLESENAILNAERLYKYMSENAKSQDTVIEAYETLTVARARYDELFAEIEAERIQRFIEAVSKIRTDLENIDITWYEALNEAGKAYWELTYDSTQLPQVEQAFERWNEAQKIFDKLGFEQIPMVDPNLLYSGDNPPHIVVQMEDNMLNPLKNFYNVSTMEELAQQAVAYLNVYVDGIYVASGELNLVGLGHIIYNTEVLSILKKLAVEHSEIVSGANFSFSIHFEDKEQRYIPSEKTKVSATKNTYTW